ncbi:hypothetical protein [Bacillus sp. V33-4]|uniref:hypothetical protein n=1 Tax=Bacillus sp. V33-4 TaxID=2054169 RepID=UPI000C788151|nr:hypothetical protein [Bacillus sp. V33-4]PLR83784.1 hypothetical protein CVD23_12925 [Bacillus sp. V33-4]
MEDFFSFNQRLGIPLPESYKSWDTYSEEDQQSILLTWEKIRGKIPDRISDLERIINLKQAALSDESDFKHSCQLNNEIAELASIINDLWLWYRTSQDISGKVHQ